MRINLAKSAGFCFGVKRAIDIAMQSALSSDNVYMLGDIVHNEDVVRKIRGCGVKKINKLAAGKNKTFLVRAHGIDKKTYEKAKRLGYKIIDATCPMVKEIHRIARTMEQKGQKIIVIGDKKHDEVRGIVGQLKTRALIIDEIKNIPIKAISRLKKASLVVQSTQDTQKVVKIVGILKEHIHHLRFFNTICQPTRLKQQEIRKMPQENDLMLIIGSKSSANTKRLYQIARSLNKKSYWINSAGEIRKEWFKDMDSVGITAGASTPDSTTKSIIAYIKKLF